MAKLTKWERAGYVGVDAGLVMVGDPCYQLLDSPSGPHPIHNWPAFCAHHHNSGKGVTDLNDHWPNGHVGVVVNSGLGDGLYPVDIRRDEQGNIAELRVKFI